jgi:elongation factor G
VVKAVVPMAELHLYATRLQSITHGYGTVRYRMHGFEQAPAEVVAKVTKEGTAE